MKYIYLTLLVIAIALSGCDVITNPIIPQQVNSSLPNTPPTYRDSSTNYTIYKVLLEDCMGHLCSNCPSAVIAGDGLIAPSNSLASHIILMEDNMGTFAIADTVAGLPDYAFNKDYICAAGNYWCTLFDINNIGYPFGMINRVGYTNASGTTFDINYANWQDTIQNALLPQYPTIPPAEINIHDSCWVPQRLIGVKFQVTFETALSGTYFLETLIIQDSIIDWQKDNLLASGYDSTFVHRNVLRGAFGNNIGGLPLGNPIPISISGTAGSIWTSYQTYDFTNGENGKATSWNMAHCYIVAFIYNGPTNQYPYQVVQTEMIKIE